MEKYKIPYVWPKFEYLLLQNHIKFPAFYGRKIWLIKILVVSGKSNAAGTKFFNTFFTLKIWIQFFWFKNLTTVRLSF